MVCRSPPRGSRSLLVDRLAVPGYHHFTSSTYLLVWQVFCGKKRLELLKKEMLINEMLFQEYFSLFASAGYDIPTISRMWVLLLHHFIISHFKTTNPWEPPPGKVKKRNRLKDCKSEPTKLVSAYRNHHLEATAVMQADQNHFLKYLHQTKPIYIPRFLNPNS